MKNELDRIYKFLMRLDRRLDSIETTLALKADKADIEAVKDAVDGLYGQIDILDNESVAISASHPC